MLSPLRHHPQHILNIRTLGNPNILILSRISRITPTRHRYINNRLTTIIPPLRTPAYLSRITINHLINLGISIAEIIQLMISQLTQNHQLLVRRQILKQMLRPRSTRHSPIYIMGNPINSQLSTIIEEIIHLINKVFPLLTRRRVVVTILG